jgi:O-antigen/teichoic acid export membrane protein
MIQQNIFANMIGRAVAVASVYLFVPLYLRFLGIEAYGLVGFYSALLGLLSFADMGFTATLSREMARLSVRRDSAKEMANLLRTYESIYLCISAAIAVGVWAMAPFIAEHWLQSQRLRPPELATAIRLMGVAITFQMPAGLYLGGLMGLQRQVRANCLQIAWSGVRGLGAVLVLWLLSPTIFAFALWQLVSNALYCFGARFSLWRAVISGGPAPSCPRFAWTALRSTWRYAGGMSALAAVSALLTQTDKLAVSKMLPLEMLGYYSVAGALATLPSALTGPIAAAVFPRLTALVALGDRGSLTRLYHRTCELVAVVTIPAGLTLAIFAGDFLFAWTGSAIAARQAGLAASLLLAGQMIQVTAVVPFYLALACNSVRLNLQVGIASVVFITPLLFYLVMKDGVAGAGMSWLIMNVCTVPPCVYLLHKRFLPGEFQRWVTCDVGRPLLAAMPCVLLGRWLIHAPSSRLLTFGLIGIVWGLSAAATAYVSPEVRSIWNIRVKPLLCSAW